MTVLIMHPNDEIFFADLQKELTAFLYKDGRIIYSQNSLWIELGDFDLSEKSKIKQVLLGELCVCENSVYCPVQIKCNDKNITSKLTLVCLHKGKGFSSDEVAALKQKPVRPLKVFRLGIEKELSSSSKCITESKWIKLHYTTSAVE